MSQEARSKIAVGVMIALVVVIGYVSWRTVNLEAACRRKAQVKTKDFALRQSLFPRELSVEVFDCARYDIRSDFIFPVTFLATALVGTTFYFLHLDKTRLRIRKR